MKHPFKNPFLHTLAAAAFLLTGATRLAAQTSLTWTGGGTNANWGTSTNWSPIAIPAASSLVFSGTTQPATSNNLSGLTVNNLTFTAGGFSLAGNAFTLSHNVTNLSGLSVIAAPLTLTTNPKTWDVAAGAELDVIGGTSTGTATGSTPFEKTDLGAVRFEGTNVWAKGGDQTNGAVIYDGSTTSLTVTNDGYRLEAVNSGWTWLQITNGATLAINGTAAGNSNLKLGSVGLLTGTNELDISSGQILLGTGVAQFLVGAGVGTIGVVNQSGGLILLQNGNATNDLLLGNSAGAVGIYNLKGGILQIPLVAGGSGGGLSYFNFNGGTLKPSTAVNVGNFIQGLTALNVQNGGAYIDTTNYSVTISQPFLNAGTGGLTKLGAGTLTLTGTNNYTGPTVVSAGELIAPTTQTGGGAFQLADGTGLGVSLSLPGTSLAASQLTLGTSSGATNEFFLGPYGNASAPVIRAANLAAHGSVTVNIYGAGFSVGQFSLIKYSTATGLGASSFVAGTLPTGVSAYVSNNVANSSIDLVVTAAPVVVWTGVVNGNWDIENTANWFSPVGQQAVDYSDGSSVLFDDTATGTPNVTLNTTVSPGGVTVNNNLLPYVISGPGSITGAGSFTKNGPGFVNLATANSYTGNTTINAGTLQLGTSQAIPGGTGAGNVTVNGELDLNGNSEVINALSGSGLIDSSTGGGVLTVGSNNVSGTFTGTITNSGGVLSLVKFGTGTQTLTGNNSYSGGVTLAGGELQIASGNALGTGLVQLYVPGAGVTLASTNGVVTITNTIYVAGNAHDPTYFDTSGGDIVLNNNVLVAGEDIFKKGYNNLWITGPSPSASLGGYLQLQQGSFIVSDGGWTNISNGIRTYAANSDTVRLVVTNGGTFAVGFSGAGPYNINLGYSGGLTGTNELDISSGQLLFGPSFVQLIAGNAVGTVGVINQTGGTVQFNSPPVNNNAGVLLGNSTGTVGSYQLNGGYLVTPQVIGGTGTGYFYFNGGTLTPVAGQLNTNFVGGFTAAYVENGGAIIDTTNLNLAVSEPLLNDGTGGLTKLGSGTLTLTGTNTYVGPTVLSNGGVWLPTSQSGGGSIAAADYTTLGVTLSASNTTLDTAGLTLGQGNGVTNLFNLQAFTNPVAPVVYATNLTVNGTVTVAVTGLQLGLGQFSLLKYGASSGISSGSFVLSVATVPVGLSAYLSNNIANSSVDLVVTPAASLLWTGINGGSWDLDVTTNWLNQGSLQSSAYIDGSFVRLDDSAPGSTSVYLSANVAPAGVWVSNNVLPYAVGGPGGIGGVGGFTKSGAGTVNVSTPNTYTGNTAINAGTYQLGASQVIPGGPGEGNLVINGRLDLNGSSDTVNGLSGSGVIDTTSGSGTLTVGSNNAAGIFNGSIINSGGVLTVAKLGTNSLLLAGNNSFGGGVQLQNGTLQIGNANALGTGALQVANIVTNNTVTVASYGGAVAVTNAITLSGGADYPADFDTTAGDLVFAGPVNSTALDITKVSTNSLRFTSPIPSIGTGRLLLNGGNLIFDGTAWTNTTGAVRVSAPSGASVHLIITNGATLALATTAAYNLRLGYTSGLAGTNELDISSGQLVLGASFEQIYAGDTSGTYGGVNQTGGTVQFTQGTTGTSGVGILLGSSAGSTGWYYLSGGLLYTPQIIGGGGNSTFYFNGGTLTPSSSATSSNFFAGVTAAYVANGGAVIDTTNINITIGQSLLNGGIGGLIKLGSAALILGGTNSYAGSTVVSNGTLAVSGSLGTNTVTVTGGALAGTGTVAGPVQVASGGTLILGSIDPYYTGTLTVSNSLVLQGNLYAKLNKSLGQSSDAAFVSGNLSNTGTGILTLTNAGPALAVGDTFSLFNQPLAGGGNLSLTPAPGAGLAWQNNLAVNGTVSVVTAPVAPVNVLTTTINGNQLTLQWPSGYAGWTLEVQTNSLNGNWYPVAGSAQANQSVFTVNPAVGSVFFKLVSP